MDITLNIPENFSVKGIDRAARARWQAVEGADGYLLRYFRADKPQRCIKTRYAEGTSKTIRGFVNGTEYLVDVCAFSRVNGTEVFGAPSEKISFVPICEKLTAQNVICLKSGESGQINWEYMNRVPDAQFYSSNPSVARVSSSGSITAYKKGTAEITVSAEEMSCTVRVIVDRDNSRLSKRRADIIVVGDLMCTSSHQREAKTRQFDFTSSFDNVRDLIKNADFSAAVLETMCCDGSVYESDELRTPVGSPNCNSPSTFISAAAYAGFSALITANNHNADTGIDGLKETVRLIEKNGMVHMGSLGANPVIADINGIKTAFICQSMISNGPEAGFEERQSTLARYSPESFAAYASEARENGAEIIISVVHWGQMNSGVVRNSQRDAAKYMAENGADVIIGSHPHVMQEFELIEAADGRKVPCIYSLGNFLTAMKELEDNRYGAAAQITVNEVNGRLSCEMKIIPAMTADTEKGVQVLPVSESFDEARSRAFERISEICADDSVIGARKHKILLQGSAVLGKIFEHSDEDIDGAGLIISPLTVFSGEGRPSDDVNTNVRTDITKSFENYMKNCGAEFIAVDFYSAAAISCIEIDGTLYTATNGFLRSAFFAQNKQRAKKLSIPFDEDMWREGVRQYAEKLLEIFPKERIILVKTTFPTMAVMGNELRNCSSRKALNRRIAHMENYFCELVSPNVIDVSKYYFRDLSDSSPSAFEPVYYDHCARIAGEITDGRTKRFYFDAPDENIMFDRAIKYYDNMSARSYQNKLLDLKLASDMLIAETSREFAAENKQRLLALRAARADLAHVEAALSSDSGASELIAAAKALEAIKNGDITKPYDTYAVIFRRKLRMVKKLAALLAEKTGADVIPENAETYLLLRDDRKALQKYAARHRRISVDIWGSCISREAVNRAPELIKVSKYIFKQPCVLSHEKPIDHQVSADPLHFCGNAWRRRTVADAFAHNGRSILKSSDSSWLIVDMYDLICNMKLFDDRLFEVDDFILRTDFYASISKQCTDTYLFDKLSTDECKEGMEKFAAFVKQRYGKHVILVKADLKDRYIDGNDRLADIKDEDGRFKDKKFVIEQFENLFAGITDCFVIDVSKHFHASDRFPLGGAHIVHYEDRFYSLACEYICDILSGGTEKYFDAPDDEYNYIRDLRLNRK